MNFLLYFIGLQVIFSQYTIRTVKSAAIICDDAKLIKATESKEVENKFAHNTSVHHLQHEQPPSYEGTNKLNIFLHKIQCSLEKAKPWIDELQQEAKRLEEAAKILGLGILNSFGDFIHKLAEDDPVKSPANATAGHMESNITTTTTTQEVSTEKISDFLCPDGFVADHNGICERIEDNLSL
ncbi:uncharacterized protein LOC142229312 [Haematobia irritans]|uniref:uncharacterized protein LOC142229312 n=1 Tax=Haematobia irritans TaxID=7368 RepID=UPI003F502478